MLKDERIRLDNDGIERVIRALALGRHDELGCGELLRSTYLLNHTQRHATQPCCTVC